MIFDIDVRRAAGKIGIGELNATDYNPSLPAAQAFDGLPVTFKSCTKETSQEETMVHLMAALTNPEHGSEIDTRRGTDYAVFLVSVNTESKHAVQPGDLIRIDQGNLEATFIQHAANKTDDDEWSPFTVRYNFK